MPQHDCPAAYRHGVQSILEQVRSDVEAGSTLADAMARHPQVFNPLFTNMIAAGEAGGILDAILQRLAIFTEKVVKLKRALKSAAIYPSAILVIAIVVVVVILWKVIPVFRALFEGFNVELPVLTRLVIAVSDFTENYFMLIATAFFLAGLALRGYYRTEDRAAHGGWGTAQGTGDGINIQENCGGTVYSHTGDASVERCANPRGAGYNLPDSRKRDSGRRGEDSPQAD